MLTARSGRPARRAGLTELRGRHPALLPLVVAAVGWAVLLGLRPPPTGHGGHVVELAAMTAAMMGALAVPLCRLTARASLWWRAGTTAAVALAVYLGLWLVAALALHALTEAAADVVGPVGVVVALAAWCGFGQLGRRRDTALRRCLPWPRLRPGHDVADAAAWSLLAGGRCVVLCAPAMALAAARPAAAATAVVSGLLLLERTRTPRHRVVLAAGYAAVGVLVAAAFPR